MKIGIAGPVTLKLLDIDFDNKMNIPVGYDFPLISMFINELLKRDFEIVVYTTSVGIKQPIIYKRKKLKICIGRRRDRHTARDLFRLERKELYNLMMSNPTDIINAQWTYEFAWASLDTGIPTLVTLRDHAATIFRYQKDPYRIIRLFMNFIVLNRAKFLSANSEYLYDKLSTKNKKKTRIIPNFYQNELIKYPNNRIGKNGYILSVSNGFSRRKNVDTGLKAFSFIRKKYHDIEYHLVGDDMELGGPAYKYARNNGLTEGVIFIGKLGYNDVKDKIIKAKILLHPALEESFGMVVLESMILGTPVIGGNYSGNIPHLLGHGKNGVLCDVRNAIEIAKGIEKILGDCEISNTLTKNARLFAQNKYSNERLIEKYIGYYKHIKDEYA